VDDYLENLREYLSNTNGLGLLVDQPWNRDRDDENPDLDQRASLGTCTLSIRLSFNRYQKANLH
jgi:hypothetical protein